jgi:hypothetical protein
MPTLLAPIHNLGFDHKQPFDLNPPAVDQFFYPHLDKRFQHQLHIAVLQPGTSSNLTHHLVLG